MIVGAGLLMALCSTARAGKIYGPVEFMGNVSMGSWTDTVSGISITATTGGTYSNGVYTNFYRIFATNSLGRLPATTNMSFAWTGSTNSSNAVVISWARFEGISTYVIEKSNDGGSTFTNWSTATANSTNFTDTGTNAWSTGDSEAMWSLIPQPSTPFATSNQAASLQSQISSNDNELTTIQGRTNTWDQAAVDGISATGRVAVVEGKTNAWDQAATDAANATGRVAVVEGKTNTYDQAAVDAASATGRVAVIEGITNSVFWLDGRYSGSKSTWGLSISPTNIGDAEGASIRGLKAAGAGIMLIANSAHGATIQGGVEGENNSLWIKNAAVAAFIHGYAVNDYGSSGMTIGNNAFGAGICGSVYDAHATNNGVGSLLLLNLTNGQTASISGSASLGLGAVTVSNNQAIVTGDGQVSHGAGSITAGGGFYGPGSGLSGVLLYVAAPASNSAPGAIGQCAWTNQLGTNWFYYFDPNGLGTGTSAWVRIQGGASW